MISMTSSQQQKQKLLTLLEQKKTTLKQLNDKCQLQNKKIKLFRKENQQLKLTIQQINQADTSMLLQSKQILSNNNKLEIVINQLTQKLNNYKLNPQQTNQKTLKTTKKARNQVVILKNMTITQSTLQIDLPALGLDDVQFLQIEHFNQLKVILINDNQLTNDSVSMICSSLQNLQRLNLANNKFTFQPMNQIHKLTNLKFLDIRNNNLGDEVLKFISRLEKLQDLCCSKNMITDNGIKYIQNLKSLKYLDITNNQITQTKSLSKLNKLTHLYLMSNKLTKETITQLIQNTQSIQFLDVRFNVWSAEEKWAVKKTRPNNMEILC